MSTELTKADPGPDAAALERVIAEGDLSKLSPALRVAYYKARCEAAGLDARTQPFQYLTLNGKLVLYATKAACDQLISGRNLDVQLGQRTFDRDSGVAEQTCRVRRPDGSIVEDLAAVHVGNLKGEALANGLMKLVTKAKRRTVLSACGLGMLDESEIDSIPGARREPMPPMDPPPAIQQAETAETPEWVDNGPPKALPAKRPPSTFKQDYEQRPAVPAVSGATLAPFDAATAQLRKATSEERVTELLRRAKASTDPEIRERIGEIEGLAAERLAALSAGGGGR